MLIKMFLDLGWAVTCACCAESKDEKRTVDDVGKDANAGQADGNDKRGRGYTVC